jgi:hypothetical protein
MENSEFDGVGVVFVDTCNIGDTIQTLAAIGASPRVDFLVSRDNMNIVYDYKTHEQIPLEKLETMKIALICNGWFMQCKDFKEKLNTKTIDNIGVFPPPSFIHPLFISFHISPNSNINLLSNECLEYYKKHEPIGCRDVYTRDILIKRGIKAHFSGCMTITLKNKYAEYERTDKVYYATNSAAPLGAERTDHVIHNYNNLSIATSFKLAEDLLEKYMRAKYVVTDRLHCYMPCRAFGTKVEFIADTNEPRMRQLINLTDAEYAEMRKNLLFRINAFVSGLKYKN